MQHAQVIPLVGLLFTTAVGGCGHGRPNGEEASATQGAGGAGPSPSAAADDENNGAADDSADAHAGPAAGTESAAAAAKARNSIKVAVLELSGVGISDITKNLEQYLRNSVGTIEGFRVISAIDVQMALGEPKNRAIARCGGGPDCARQVGGLVGADIVIIGSISALGDTFSLNLRALEVKTKKERARYQAGVSGRDRLIPEVRLAAYRLVAPDRIRGWLIVEVPLSGVEVEVDGQIVGTTPLAKPVENLSPGAHLVLLKRPGYQPFQQEFTIKPFEPTRLKIAFDNK